MGIHNEPGLVKRSIEPASTLVRSMVDMILDKEDKERAYLQYDSSSKAVLLVNNLGGLSNLELHLVVKEAVEACQGRLLLERVYAGTFLTSIDMQGFSVSLLTPLEKDTLAYLDDPVQAPGWPVHSHAPFSANIDAPLHSKQKQETVSTEGDVPVNPDLVRAAAQAVIAAEPEITSYDTILGDGDCGLTLKAAAAAILEKLPQLPVQSGVQTLLDLADLIENTVGGTSAAIYCIYINALAGSLSKARDQQGLAQWAKASALALEALQVYTMARVGDRTMMDTLIPFVETLSAKQDVAAAIEAAQKGAESTRHMHASMGRASYVPDEDVKKASLPDAGAYGLSALLTGLGKALKY
ncbi:dhal domain-containing protein [Syncephalastrum racemosum]|uniref:Dhal domain-containing protein n=1 Tax=Syncephalastrum racemosum TaxID=13706 RepID=A0A1X2H2L9_SYNRA|nr:dhal domain-containing protein [Syncephalastrum racemosum]